MLAKASFNVCGEDEILESLCSFFRGSGVSGAIQAGHYSLDLRSGIAEDHLDEPPALNQLAQSFTDFARHSWVLACEYLATTSADQVPVLPKLMTLVNDWQFMRPGPGPRRPQERASAKARRTYYKRVQTMPAFHLETLADANLHQDSVLKRSADQWLFSEDELRRGFTRTLRRLQAEGKGEELGIHEETTCGGDPVVRVRSMLEREVCVLYCGNSNCAGEVVELLRVLHERGIRRFANLFPRECELPVEVGTKLAGAWFGLEGMQVMNAALAVSRPGVDSAPLLGRVAIIEFDGRRW